jgi:hypothetical protein
MAEQIRELIRQYQDGKITRREFIFKAVALTGSLAVSHALIDALAPFPCLRRRGRSQ